MTNHRALGFCLLFVCISGSLVAASGDDLTGHFTFDKGSLKSGMDGVQNAVPGAPGATIDTSVGAGGDVAEEPKGLIAGAAAFTPPVGLRFGSDNTFGDFGTRSFTFSGWIHVSKPPDGVNRLKPIIGKGRENQAAPGWALFLRSPDGEEGVQLAFAAHDEGEIGITLYPLIIGFEPGRWQHVAAVVNREEGTITLYVNGMQVGSRTIGSLGSMDNNNPLIIGRWGNTAVSFEGMFDDFALWSRALSDSEISDIHAKGLKGVPIGLNP